MRAGTAAARKHEIYRAESELWIVLKDRVVLEDIDGLKEAIMPAIVRGIDHVYVDLQLVDFMDSAGLGLLISFKMTAKMHGAGMTLIDPSSSVLDVLSTSKIDGIFAFVTKTDAEALRDRLAKASNRLADNADPSSVDAGALDSPEGEHFPQVTSAGSFQDTKSEVARVQDLVEEQCRNAVESMRQGDYENSIEAYKSALALDPDYLPALNNLAIVYEKQPIWHPMAIDAWNRVLDLSRQRNDDKHRNRAERHLADLVD